MTRNTHWKKAHFIQTISYGIELREYIMDTSYRHLLENISSQESIEIKHPYSDLSIKVTLIPKWIFEKKGTRL